MTHIENRSTLESKAIVFGAAVLAALSAGAQDAAYTFVAERGSGAAIVRVDTEARRIVEHRALFARADCAEPEKLRFSRSGALLAVADHDREQPRVFLVRPDTDAPPAVVRLPGPPAELRARGESFVICCESGEALRLDADTETPAASWAAQTALDPPGHAPEDLLVAPGGRRAILSFQKDEPYGPRRGNRLAVLDLPGLQTRADLRLPHVRPELHIPGNRERQGPGPELLLASPQANVLLVTLDLYGVVALMDLDAALAGTITNLTYLPTAPDGKWGTAFPDRGLRFAPHGQDCFLVCNAGRKGGAVLIDAGERAIRRRYDVPHGLEAPVYLAALKAAVAVCPGKLKQRKGIQILKSYKARKSVYVFDFSSPATVRDAPVRTVELDLRLFGAAAVDPPNSTLLFLAAGKKEPDTILLFDLAAGRVVESQPAKGTVGRIESRVRPAQRGAD
ncbi:MAG: hypothetical protein JXR37_03775 [Kiritimatiellae bacterium]|nr:hypothetical protein [Kiritimatiellia bacterium]